MRRKGELSVTAINRGWPFQVAVKIIDDQSIGHINATGPLSSLCPRGRTIGDGSHIYRVYCFSDRGQAIRFRDIVGGEDFDPTDMRGGRWRRPPAKSAASR